MTSLSKKEYKHKWYMEHREKIRAKQNNRYHTDLEYRKKMAEYYSQYYKAHNEKIKSRRRARYKTNKTKERAYQAEYYKRNKEAFSQYSKKYRDSHKEYLAACKKIYVETHREQTNAAVRRWAKAHPEHSRIRNTARRARKTNASGTGFTKSAFIIKLNDQRGRCFYCGKKMNQKNSIYAPDYPTIDHVLPLNKGGKHDPSNIVIACRKCNSHKHQSLPSFFAGMLDL